MNPYDLTRFTEAHEMGYQWGVPYNTALKELEQGYKCSCWMWYVFPQIHGLGNSQMTRRFAIQNLDEAKAFLAHPILGENLRRVTDALLQNPCSDPLRVMGPPDDKKLHSSMTLFACAAPEEQRFRAVLEKYFHGRPDRRTLGILGMEFPQGK